jgi:hypothetical protein
MGNTRDLNSLVGELRRQLSALSKAIGTFEDLAERKLEEHHSKSQSLFALSRTLTSEGPTAEGHPLRIVWSRPERVVTAAAAGPSSLPFRES